MAAAKVHLQVDVGFGDAVTPGAVDVTFPTLLEFPPRELRADPPETVVAEKLEALVQPGLANTRMKDFYDLVILSRMFEFNGEVLRKAIQATFDRRPTLVPLGLPVALTPEFATDKSKLTQWKAFLRRFDVHKATDLASAIAAITEFAGPVLAAAGKQAAFGAHWVMGGPWK